MPTRPKSPIQIRERRPKLADINTIAEELAQEIQRREKLENRITVMVNDLESSLRDDIAAERLEIRRLREALKDFARWIAQ